MEIDLQEDRLEVFGADLMEDFVKDQHPIQTVCKIGFGSVDGLMCMLLTHVHTLYFLGDGEREENYFSIPYGLVLVLLPDF